MDDPEPPAADEPESQRVRRRRRRHRSSDEPGNRKATEAAGITLDSHDWHAGGRRDQRRRGRDGRDSGKRNVNPLVRRSNRIFVRIALAILAAVAVWTAYQYGKREGIQGERHRQMARSTSALPATGTASELRRQALAEVDLGYAARAQGQVALAREHFRKAKDLDPRLPGAYVEMALLWLRDRNPVEADTLLLQSIRAEEDLARAHYHRGVLLAGNNSFPEAFVAFQTATEVAPFDPYPWFYWGDALRSYGRPSEALEKFHRAELRASEQSDLFVIRAKRLLCMVEAEAPELQGLLDTALASPEPSGEWILAAAALALRKEQYPAAAGLLARARQSLQPLFFSFLTGDKFFDLYRARKELAPVLAAGPAPTVPPTLPPPATPAPAAAFAASPAAAEASPSAAVPQSSPAAPAADQSAPGTIPFTLSGPPETL